MVMVTVGTVSILFFLQSVILGEDAMVNRWSFCLQIHSIPHSIQGSWRR